MVGVSKVVFMMYFARIDLRVFCLKGGSDMSCLENAEPKYTIFGSNGHKNALFGGLAFLI